MCFVLCHGGPQLASCGGHKNMRGSGKEFRSVEDDDTTTPIEVLAELDIERLDERTPPVRGVVSSMTYTTEC